MVIQMQAIEAGKLVVSEAQKTEKASALAYERDVVFGAMTSTID